MIKIICPLCKKEIKHTTSNTNEPIVSIGQYYELGYKLIGVCKCGNKLEITSG